MSLWLWGYTLIYRPTYHIKHSHLVASSCIHGTLEWNNTQQVEGHNLRGVHPYKRTRRKETTNKKKSYAVWYIDLLILTIYLAPKPFQTNISIFWFYRYILLENLSKRIYQFLIFLINLARKLFWANILIFWFYWCILLENISKQIYQFFDFNDISCSKTFPSEYIDFLILSIYLARKPFQASISIFWF